MLELKGLYRKLELLNKYLSDCNKELEEARLELNNKIEECRSIKNKLNTILSEKEYLETIEKDLILDIEAVSLKDKVESLEGRKALLTKTIEFTKSDIDKFNNKDNISKVRKN